MEFLDKEIPIANLIEPQSRGHYLRIKMSLALA